jgi:hypothetical protein
MMIVGYFNFWYGLTNPKFRKKQWESLCSMTLSGVENDWRLAFYRTNGFPIFTWEA